MLQFYFPAHPQNHKEREDEQCLQLHGKGRAVKPHAGPVLPFQQKEYAAQNQKGIDDIALGPHRRIQDHGRQKQKETVRELCTLPAFGAFRHDPGDDRRPGKFQQTADAFESSHGIHRKKRNPVQKVHNRRRIVIKILRKCRKSPGPKLQKPAAPVDAPVIRHKRAHLHTNQDCQHTDHCQKEEFCALYPV